MKGFAQAWGDLLRECSNGARLPAEARDARLAPLASIAQEAAKAATGADVAACQPMRHLASTWGCRTPWIARACSPALAELSNSGALWAETFNSHDLFELWKSAPDAAGFVLSDPVALRKLFTSSRPEKLEGSYALSQFAAAAARLDRQERARPIDWDKFLPALQEAGLGGAWVLGCSGQGFFELAERSLKTLSLSGLGQAFSQAIFRQACRARTPAMDRLDANEIATERKASKGERREAIAAAGKAKARLWRALRAAGLEPVGGVGEFDDEGHEAPLDPHRMIECPSAAWVLKAEAELGGALSGPAASLWARFSKSPRWLDLESQLWEGSSGAAWAFAHGMDPLFWTPSRLRWIQGAEPASGMSFLKALADAGRVFEPGEPGLNDAFSVAFDAQCPAVESLTRMGADPRVPDRQGRHPLQALCQQLPPAERPLAAKALFERANARWPQASAQLLGAKASDESGPMHWAAAARCKGTIELLAGLGAGVEDLDEKKRSPAHAIARAVSKSDGDKGWQALDALDRLGADWARLDAKGTSAIAMLVSKGCVDEAMELAKARPQNLKALQAKGPRSMSAAEIARRVGGAAWAKFERGSMDIEALPVANKNSSRGSRL